MSARRNVTPILSLLATILLAAHVPGCGDQPGPGDPDPGGPGGPSGSNAATKVALQSVVKQFTVPRKASDYALDLDGDGTVDNKLGQISDAISKAVPNMNWAASLEQHIASNIATGYFLALVQVYGQTNVLHTQPVAGVQIDLGRDRDSNPADNFTGAEELSLYPSSPGTKIGGSITGGALTAGPGELVAPMIVAGTQLLLIRFKLARVTGNVSPAGIFNGKLTGAVPRKEMDSKLMPAFAAYFTESYQKTMTDPAQKAMVKQLFDFNKDGVITAAELKASIVGLALQPDVDTDGDGVKDGISVGFGFTAVPCLVVP